MNNVEYKRDWGAIARLIVVPTVFFSGAGAAMSLVAKDQYRGAIIGTGAAIGGLIGVLTAGGLGAFQEKRVELPASEPKKPVGTGGLLQTRFP